MDSHIPWQLDRSGAHTLQVQEQHGRMSQVILRGLYGIKVITFSGLLQTSYRILIHLEDCVLHKYGCASSNRTFARHPGRTELEKWQKRSQDYVCAQDVYMVNPVPFLFACKWAEAKKARHEREKQFMEALGSLGHAVGEHSCQLRLGYMFIIIINLPASKTVQQLNQLWLPTCATCGRWFPMNNCC